MACGGLVVGEIYETLGNYVNFFLVGLLVAEHLLIYPDIVDIVGTAHDRDGAKNRSSCAIGPKKASVSEAAVVRAGKARLPHLFER